MYKVLLVDDEYYYREALKNTISWEACGCCICGDRPKQSQCGCDSPFAQLYTETTFG